MNALQNTAQTENKHVNSLKAILYLLQENLEGFKDEVDRSYALLEVGERTNLSKQIEDSLNNPFQGVFKISADIDEQVKSIINKIVIAFFRYNKNIVKSVFKSHTSINNLHYSIILNEDNLENRSKIFEFFDNFDLIDISAKYPVYFQFVPVELVSRINFIEELKLD